MKPPRPSPAETLCQARTWEVVKLRYIDVGLCERCAAQAAWGHQTQAGGWHGLRPPCASCAPVVAAFGLPKTNDDWRKLDSPAHRKRQSIQIPHTGPAPGHLVACAAAGNAAPNDTVPRSLGTGASPEKFFRGQAERPRAPTSDTAVDGDAP
jgi:hypothetical protein